MTGPALIWFRRDLRLHDLPMLAAAADDTDRALAVFVLDDALLRPAGAPRTDFLRGCLRALNESLNGRLLLVKGRPAQVIARLADTIDADAVHISADFGPYGSRRDDDVEQALRSVRSGVPLLRTGSSYAVSPGRLHTKTGGPYQVFGAYRRAWIERGWHSPARTSARSLQWIDPPELAEGAEVRSWLESLSEDNGPRLFEPGEAAARARWRRYRDDDLDAYAADRDRPDRDATTRLSPYLKFGCLHPRTILHDIATRSDDSARTLRSELAWRDFYADVLHHRPASARHNYNAKFDDLRHDTGPSASQLFDAWRDGRTGYPIVDAGMRQLRAQAWMHNRVRMITASFLTKDLHLPWWWGARHFMSLLVDGDLASNQHGWQWTAGSGTDAAPYFRVFNPTAQGERFDPTGDYVRRWVPELRGIAGKAVHQPWDRRPDLFDAEASRYPAPIVDHAEQRREALRRYGEL